MRLWAPAQTLEHPNSKAELSSVPHLSSSAILFNKNIWRKGFPIDFEKNPTPKTTFFMQAVINSSGKISCILA